MKKKDLSKLALKGLTAGLLLSAPQLGATENMGSNLAQNCGSGGGCRSQNSRGSCNANRGSCSANRVSCRSYRAAPQASCNSTGGTCGGQAANNTQHYKEYTRTISQGCQPKQQNINTPQGSCGGGKIASSCGANCSGKSIANADEANNTMRETQRKYYDSSDENPNRTDTMTPDKSQINPQGKYLADSQMTSGQKIQTESELLSRLDTQGKAAYQSLSTQGKALAIQLANEENGNKYPDKNMAVRAAAERTNATQKKW